MAAVPRVLESKAVDANGVQCELVWKCRRRAPGEPFRWEIRRLLDTHFSWQNMKYNSVINKLIMDWQAIWSDVELNTPLSYWPSRRATRDLVVNADCTDEEYTFDTVSMDTPSTGLALYEFHMIYYTRRMCVFVLCWIKYESQYCSLFVHCLYQVAIDAGFDLRRAPNIHDYNFAQ